MPTDTQVNDLKINVLSEAQYEQIQSPSSTELYLVPDIVDTTPTSGSTNPITSGGVYTALQNIPAQEQADWSENDATDPAFIKNKPQNIVTDANYVHTDNNYTTTEKNKLAGIEAGAEANVQSDWNQTNSSADDYIKNKPTIPAAQVNSDWNASSGAAEILNKPTIPTVNDSTITILSNNEEIDNFTLNSADDSSINIPDTDFVYVVTSHSNNTLTAESKSGQPPTTGYNFVYFQSNITLTTSSTSEIEITLKIGSSGTAYPIIVDGIIIKITNSKPYTFNKGLYFVQLANYWFFDTQGCITINGIRFSCSYYDLDDVPNLSTVATSGNYNDLSNKPNLATVATSGSYNDLSNKPTIPDPLPSITNNAGKVLAVNSTETDVEWVSTQECMWYGVRKDRSNDSTTLERIGNLEMHKTLPIQSKMRRCLLLDNGTVNYYLSDTDSTKKEDGVTAAVLDGTDGQVMVEIPAHYQRFDIYTDEVTGHEIEERKISEVALPGFEYVPVRYFGAFEAALDRTNGKLASVINTTAQYRGGNNTSDWDGTYRSLLGMPVTFVIFSNFRILANARGSRWTCQDNNIYETVCNLYFIEYANTNCQLEFNNTLTTEGYRQGGLGNGVTGMTNWNTYNNYYPIVPCGVTVGLGNSTGTETYNVIASNETSIYYAAQVPSYRGIENLFGHIWKYTDGILVNAQSANDGGKSMVYKCVDPTKYTNTLTADYKYVGDEARNADWTKNVLTPTMVASEIGASSTTGYGDFHTNEIPSSGSSVRLVSFGGSGADRQRAGIAYSYTRNTTSSLSQYFGTRLCYTPMTVNELPPLEGNSGKVLAVNSGETGVEWVTQLPAVTSADNGKILVVENGVWVAKSVADVLGS